MTLYVKPKSLFSKMKVNKLKMINGKVVYKHNSVESKNQIIWATAHKLSISIVEQTLTSQCI